MRSSFSIAGIAAMCACLCCTPALADDSAVRASVGRYQQLLKEGVDAFSQGEWQAARSAFERAHALSPTARTFRGLALCDFELGNYAHSARELESSLNDARRPLTPELRAQVLKTLERALREAGRVHLVLPEEVRELRVDGSTEPLPEGGVVLLDPGPHTLELRLPGREPITRELSIQNGVTQNLIFAGVSTRHVDPQPSAAGLREPQARPEAPAGPARPSQPAAAEASSTRVWSWVALGLTGALGAGAAGLAVAAGEKHAAFSAQRDAYAAHLAAGESGTPPSAALKRSGQRLELLTNLSLAGCAALGVATITLFVLEQPDRERAPQLRAAVGPTGFSLYGRF